MSESSYDLEDKDRYAKMLASVFKYDFDISMLEACPDTNVEVDPEFFFPKESGSETQLAMASTKSVLAFKEQGSSHQEGYGEEEKKKQPKRDKSAAKLKSGDENLHGVKPRRFKNACKRCVDLKNVGPLSTKKKKKNFYCDVGMRSVLRQIRRRLLVDLDFKKDTKNIQESQDVNTRVVSFYRENILLEEDLSSSDLSEEHQIFDAHIIQLMHFFLEVKPKKFGDFLQTSRYLKSGKRVQQRYSLSTFSKFGKKIFLKIEDNPAADDFIDYLTAVY